MQTVITAVFTFVVCAVGAYASGMYARRRTLRQVELWIATTEAWTRSHPTPAGMVELPGYQGILRRFRNRFINGVQDAS